MIIPSYSSLTAGAAAEKSIKIRYPEFYQYLAKTYPDLSWREKLYWYFHQLTEYPVCPVCGSKTSFVNIKEGYRTYCCRTCMNRDPNKQERVRITCNEKYGGDAPACSSDIQNKMRQTNLERYGAENAMQNKSVSQKSHDTNVKKYGGCGNASVELLDKYKQTNLSKYGAENVMQTELGQTRLKETLVQKYGVAHPSQIEGVVDKIARSRRNRTLNKYDDVISISDADIWVCKCPHPECTRCIEKTYEVRGSVYRDRKRDHTERCTRLLKECNTRTSGTSIELFIRNILDEIGVSYVCNDKTIICPKELDLVIPDKHIAIECNGIQSHYYPYKEPSYHYKKYLACKQKGVQLLTIWQDQIENRPDVVRSIVRSKLGIYDRRIYARKCEVVELEPSVCCKFLDNNHIQGRTSAKVHLGLLYEGDIVCVMTFGSKRRCSGNNKSATDEWELSRFCTIMNTQVVGGAAKLLKYFIRHYHPAAIYSFSSNDISGGGLYKTLGFVECGSNQGYWYIDIKSMKRYHRSTFTKDSIVDRGWKDTKDGWTEQEVMLEHGYYQIYDSGQIKWVLGCTKFI